MILYIPKSEREETATLLSNEGVTFEMGHMVSIREMGTGSYEMFTVKASVEEIPIPPM